MPFTNYLDQKIVQLLFGDTTYSVPATWYVALSTTTPAQAEGSTPHWNFTEPSGNGYARVSVANTSTHWEATTTEPSNGYTMVNKTAVTFPTPTGSWGTVTYFGIFDASTGGNLIGYGALTTSKAIGSGDTPPTFAIKALTVTNN